MVVKVQKISILEVSGRITPALAKKLRANRKASLRQIISQQRSAGAMHSKNDQYIGHGQPR
jgi:hypothetical protein